MPTGRIVTDLSDATAAGILIGAGFSGRTPSEGSDYGRALERYRSEVGFRNLVDSFAHGLGLTVLGTPQTGIVLAPVEGSPFAFRLSDLGSRVDSEERLLLGLALLGIAALAYPRDETLEASTAQILSVDRVERFIRAAIDPLKALDGDAETIDARVRSAALAWDRLPAFKPMAQLKGPAKGCTQRVIVDVFERLVEQRMARSGGARFGEDHYLLTDRFRLMVGEVAGGDGLEALRRVAQERGHEFREV
jgi:hypothetical protein